VFKLVKNTIYENKNALLLSAFLLCAFGFYICEASYAGYIEHWDNVYPYKQESPFYYNPFGICWHILRWKLFAAERMCIALFAYFMLPAPGKLFPWKNIAFIYFQFGLENFIDRVFFNEWQLGFNDYIVYAWVLLYSLKTLIDYAASKR
jgi:hypothetical protein